MRSGFWLVVFLLAGPPAWEGRADIIRPLDVPDPLQQAETLLERATGMYDEATNVIANTAAGEIGRQARELLKKTAILDPNSEDFKQESAKLRTQRDDLAAKIASIAAELVAETPELVMKRWSLMGRVAALADSVASVVTDSPQIAEDIATLKRSAGELRAAPVTATNPYAPPHRMIELLDLIETLLQREAPNKNLDLREEAAHLTDLTEKLDDKAARLAKDRSNLRGRAVQIVETTINNAVSLALGRAALTTETVGLYNEIAQLPAKTPREAEVSALVEKASRLIERERVNPVPFTPPTRAKELLDIARQLLEHKLRDDAATKATTKCADLDERASQLTENANALAARRDAIEREMYAIVHNDLYKAARLAADRQRKLKRAADMLHELTRANPKLARAHYLLAKAQAGRDRHRQALPSMLRALHNAPNDFDIRLLAGSIFAEAARRAPRPAQKMHRALQAMKHFKKALAQAPDNIEILHWLLGTRNLIVELQPDNPTIFKDSISEMEIALGTSSDPDAVNGLLGRAHRIYALNLPTRPGGPPHGETPRDTESTQTPPDPSLVQERIKHFRLAVHHFEQVPDVSTEYYYALQDAATAVNADGKPEEAVRMITSRIEKATDPERKANLLNVLASIYIVQERITDARRALVECVRNCDLFAQGHLRLAMMDIETADKCQEPVTFHGHFIAALNGKVDIDKVKDALLKAKETENPVKRAYRQFAGANDAATRLYAIMHDLIDVIPKITELLQELPSVRKAQDKAAKNDAFLVQEDVRTAGLKLDEIEKAFADGTQTIRNLDDEDVQKIRDAFADIRRELKSITFTSSPIKPSDAITQVRRVLENEAKTNSRLKPEQIGRIAGDIRKELNSAAPDTRKNVAGLFAHVEKVIKASGNTSFSDEAVLNNIRKGLIQAHSGLQMAGLARLYKALIYLLSNVENASKSDAWQELTDATEKHRKEAIRRLRKVIDISPDLLVAYRLIGMQYRELENYSGAERYFSRAFSIDRARAVILAPAGKREQAITRVLLSCAQSLARIHQRNEAYHKALTAAKRAIKLSDSPENNLLAGQSAFQDNQLEIAGEYLLKAIAVSITEKLRPYTPQEIAEDLPKEIINALKKPALSGKPATSLQSTVETIITPDGATDEIKKQIADALEAVTRDDHVRAARKGLSNIALRRLRRISLLQDLNKQLSESDLAIRENAIISLIGQETAICTAIEMNTDTDNAGAVRESPLRLLDQTYRLASIHRGAWRFRKKSGAGAVREPRLHCAEARKLLEYIRKSEPKAISAYLLEAVTCEQLGEIEPAIRLLEQALEIKREEAVLLFPHHDEARRASMRGNRAITDATITDAKALLARIYARYYDNPEKARKYLMPSG